MSCFVVLNKTRFDYIKPKAYHSCKYVLQRHTSIVLEIFRWWCMVKKIIKKMSKRAANFLFMPILSSTSLLRWQKSNDVFALVVRIQKGANGVRAPTVDTSSGFACSHRTNQAGVNVDTVTPRKELPAMGADENSICGVRLPTHSCCEWAAWARRTNQAIDNGLAFPKNVKGGVRSNFWTAL